MRVRGPQDCCAQLRGPGVWRALATSPAPILAPVGHAYRRKTAPYTQTNVPACKRPPQTSTVLQVCVGVEGHDLRYVQMRASGGSPSGFTNTSLTCCTIRPMVLGPLDRSQPQMSRDEFQHWCTQYLPMLPCTANVPRDIGASGVRHARLLWFAHCLLAVGWVLSVGRRLPPANCLLLPA